MPRAAPVMRTRRSLSPTYDPPIAAGPSRKRSGVVFGDCLALTGTGAWARTAQKALKAPSEGELWQVEPEPPPRRCRERRTGWCRIANLDPLAALPLTDT
jgi:hypothetical protein